jgi:hypothetical protein
MAFNVVFLDPAGLPANKTERKTDCIATTGLKVGAIASLSVTVKNIGDANCNLCSTQFFYQRSGDPAPTSIPGGQTVGGANPLPPTSLTPGQTNAFLLQWVVPSGDAGAGTVYAQIQTQSPPPHIDPTDMSLTCNAERNVIIGLDPLAATNLRIPTSPVAEASVLPLPMTGPGIVVGAATSLFAALVHRRDKLSRSGKSE